jgi:hypothetical protein
LNSFRYTLHGERRDFIHMWNISYMCYKHLWKNISTLRLKIILIFLLWTCYFYTVFQQHLYMEYLSLSRYNISKVPVVLPAVLNRVLLLTKRHWTKYFKCFYSWSNFTVAIYYDIVNRYGISMPPMTMGMLVIIPSFIPIS